MTIIISFCIYTCPLIAILYYIKLYGLNTKRSEAIVREADGIGVNS
jgi:hypothetical protein